MKSKYRTKYKRNRQSVGRPWFWGHWVGGLCFAYLLFWLIQNFFVFVYHVHSNEMAPYFQTGDRLLILRNFQKKNLLERFILIENKEYPKTFYLRKVVALPGDKIYMQTESENYVVPAFSPDPESKKNTLPRLYVNKKRDIGLAHDLSITKWKMKSLELTHPKQTDKSTVEISPSPNNSHSSSQSHALPQKDQSRNRKILLFTLEENQYYAIGSKNTSLDSRLLGPIDEMNILGVVYQSIR